MHALLYRYYVNIATILAKGYVHVHANISDRTMKLTWMKMSAVFCIDLYSILPKVMQYKIIRASI